MSHALYVFKVTGVDSWKEARDAVDNACEEAGDENNWYDILETHDFKAGRVYGPKREKGEPPREYHDEAYWDRFATSLMVFDLLSAAPKDSGGICAYFTPEDHMKRVEELTDKIMADKDLFYKTAVDVGKAILAEGPDPTMPPAPYSMVGYHLAKVARALGAYPEAFPWKEGAYMGDFYEYRTFRIDADGGTGRAFVVTVDIHT
jgi:hypothetical protein